MLLWHAVGAICIGKQKVGVAGGCGCSSLTERDCVVVVWFVGQKVGDFRVFWLKWPAEGMSVTKIKTST